MKLLKKNKAKFDVIIKLGNRDSELFEKINRIITTHKLPKDSRNTKR